MPVLQRSSFVLRRRPARTEDEALLFALFASDKRVEFAAFGVPAEQAEILVDMQYRGRKMTYAAEYPLAEDWILLAHNGLPVGRLLINRRPDCWRILDIAILPEHRGCGLGTSVIEECQARCKEAGVKLELQVAAANPARTFYERLGFCILREDSLAFEMVWSAFADTNRTE